MVTVFIAGQTSCDTPCNGTAQSSFALRRIWVVWHVRVLIALLLLLMLWIGWVALVRRLLMLAVATMLLLVRILRSTVATGILWWRVSIVTFVPLRVARIVGSVLAARLAVLGEGSAGCPREWKRLFVNQTYLKAPMLRWAE